VNRGIERFSRRFIFDAFENHGDFAHGAAHESALAGESRCSALADHPKILTAVCLAPGKVVVVVNFFGDGCAQNLGDAPADPIAPGIGISAASSMQAR